MAKDFRNIEYHTNQDGDGVRYYACSTLNTQRKELIFHKNKGAIVQMRWKVVTPGKGIQYLIESFNFTPEFGQFVEYTNLFDYINQLCCEEKNIDMKITNLQVTLQKVFVFKINPLNLKLGHLWLCAQDRTKNYKWDNNDWLEV